MHFQIINQFNKTQWSGGSTTELYISPTGSSFKSGQYDFRLSLAEIKDTPSVFTSLPGTQRTFTLLTGGVTLKHQGHHERELKPLDQDQFEGAWQTESLGTGTVFNLISKDVTSSMLMHKGLAIGEILELSAAQENQMAFAYLLNGVLEIAYAEEKHLLQSDELLVLKNESIRLTAHQASHLILVSVILAD